MQEFRTMDKSITLYNEIYQEYYHSKSGAIEEAFEKYVKPCKIPELAKHNPIRILDIGFGLGYNAIAAIDSAMESNPNSEIEVISLEKDENILEEVQKLNPPLKYFFITKKLEYDPKTKSYLYEDRNIFFRMKLGDARETVKKLTGKFDAVFFDPFSPKNNPELWNVDFMKDVADKMKKEAILATYSYAKSVRENFKQAGFVVFDGPIIGRRSPCTLARLKN